MCCGFSRSTKIPRKENNEETNMSLSLSPAREKTSMQGMFIFTELMFM